MTKKIGYLQRWMLIIDVLDRHPYISLKELVDIIGSQLPYYDGVEETGVSRRTILRDIKDIRESPYFDVDIEYNLTRKGYKLYKSELSQSKFDRMLELTSLVSIKDLSEVILPQVRQPRGLQYMPRLVVAIKKQVEVCFEYAKFEDNASGCIRKVEPYALKEFRGRWYLIATEIDGNPSEKGCFKTWGLDRMDNLNITTRKFWKNPNLNPVDEFDGCFGICSNRENQIEEVVLSFPPFWGRYNDSLPLHQSQETLIEDDNELRVKLKVRLTDDFIMELLGQSEFVKVISPDHLREKLTFLHQKAILMLK